MPSAKVAAFGVVVVGVGVVSAVELPNIVASCGVRPSVSAKGGESALLPAVVVERVMFSPPFPCSFVSLEREASSSGLERSRLKSCEPRLSSSILPSPPWSLNFSGVLPTR